MRKIVKESFAVLRKEGLSASDSDATIISIDLRGGRFGGGYPKWRVPIYKSFVRGDQKIYLIRVDSHDSKTFEEMKNILGG